SEAIRFEGENREQVYGWVEPRLRQQQYQKQGRKARGLLRRYLEKMTGLSRAQVTRLIAHYRAHGELQPAPYRRHRFPQRYTRADIELLAIVDEAHESLSGPATRRILQRQYPDYGKSEYQRLASISVAHWYNLRHHQRYRQPRLHDTKTRPMAVSIGERRGPDPQGRPGYLRVDTVHQGDRAEAKGVYHINAVDQVTQWEIVSATARSSEAWLEPVLAALLRQFPFPILGLHSANGSEFINQTVICRILVNGVAEWNDYVSVTTRFQHSEDLAHRCHSVACVFEYGIAFYATDRFTGEGQRFDTGNQINPGKAHHVQIKETVRSFLSSAANPEAKPGPMGQM